MIAQRTAPSGTSSALIARDFELAQGTAVIGAKRSLLVIEGEAGIGKSRLLHELLDRRDPGVTVLAGQCRQLYAPFPLGPILEALRDQGDRIDPASLSPVAGALAPLLPEIAERLPAEPPALADPHENRHRIFRGAIELIAHLAPAILVIEDAHWADSATNDFLSLIATAHPEGVAIVVTTRSEGGTFEAAEAFARATAGPAQTIRLDPLDAAGVAALAAQILATDISNEAATALHEATGGIPFVIEEVLRTVATRHADDALPTTAADFASLEATTALRDVVRQRLAGLEPRVRDMLETAAAGDRALDAELIAAVTGQGGREIADSMSRALAAGLIHEAGLTIRFRHVLAKQIVYDETAAPTRRWIHGRIAEVLEARGTVDHSEIAHHYERAGRGIEFARHAELAADAATARGDDIGAASLLLRAVTDPLPLDVRVRIATKLGRAAVDGLAQAEAAPVIERLLATGELPAPARGELRFALGRLYRQEGRALEGYHAIAESVDELAHRPELQARALATLAAPTTVIDVPLTEHEERCRRATAVARDAGSAVQLSVRIAHVSLLLEMGEPAAWHEMSEMSEPLAEYPRETARAALNWAQGALHLGHVRGADALLAAARDVIGEGEAPRLAEVLEVAEALADYSAGRWDQLITRTADLAERSLSYSAVGDDARWLHAMLMASVGDPREAARLLTAVERDCARSGAVWPLVAVRSVAAQTLISLGEIDAGLIYARGAIEQARAKGLWVWAGEPVQQLAPYLPVADAASLVRELEAGLDGLDAPFAQVALRRAQAELAQRAGGEADPALLLAEALDAAENAGLLYLAARVREQLGTLLLERGAGLPERGAGGSVASASQEEAGADGGALLESALQAYGSLGARRDIERTTRAMRAHGVPVPYPWRGGRVSNGSGLSKREEQVARLAAAGRTNKEIAAELFLSPRTVETHIAHALTKLGISSREDIAAELDA